MGKIIKPIIIRTLDFNLICIFTKSWKLESNKAILKSIIRLKLTIVHEIGYFQRNCPKVEACAIILDQAHLAFKQVFFGTWSLFLLST
jgi:hypothetical protein